MSIQYEIHNIENAAGSGQERKYVQLRSGKAKTLDEMAALIERSSTVTRSDFKAVMSEFCHFAVQELAEGNRVYIPEIGYLSLSVGNTPPEDIKSGKITGKDIFLRSVNFQPEAQLMEQLRGKVSFEKSGFSTLSVHYAEDDLWQKVKSYLSENRFITRRAMMEQFGLSGHLAAQWLSRFVGAGRLTREKVGKQLLYYLK